MLSWDKKSGGQKKVSFIFVLIPWYPISYLTFAGYGFLGGGAYGSLPDAAIGRGRRSGGGGILTSLGSYVLTGYVSSTVRKE